MVDQSKSDPGQFWDERFAGEEYYYGTEPNAWLASQAHRFQPGAGILAVADGEGRNGVWLAGQGHAVTAVDASAQALRKAGSLAQARGVTIELVQADLRHWDWPEGGFDGVVSIFAHFTPKLRPQLHGRMLRALKPGGLLLLQAYSPYQRIYQTGGPQELDLLYTAYRLQQDFQAAEILLLEEALCELAEGKGHHGTSAVVNLIARRQAA